MQTEKKNIEQTIERIQNGIVKLLSEYSFNDQAIIYRELENFCGQKADEALKLEYDMAAMEEWENE